MALDNRLLVSLHGNRVGLTRGAHLVEDNHVLVPSWRDRGSRVKLMDHFVGPVMDANKWTSFKGSDGSAAYFAFVAAKGGIVRGATGAGASTVAVNGTQICGSLNFEADQSGVEFGSSVKLSAITNAHVFVGMTNQVAALQTPGTISGGTLTVVANDFCGFMFDTAATAATWKFVSAIGGVANPIIDTGIAPVTTLYDAFQMDIDVLGNVTAHLLANTGVDVVVQQALALTVTAPISPTIVGFRRTTASMNIDVDFIYAEMDRPLG